MPKDAPCSAASSSCWDLLDEAWKDAESRCALAKSFSLPRSLVVQEDQLARLTLSILVLMTSPALRVVIDNRQ